jgi:hypothetical protein
MQQTARIVATLLATALVGLVFFEAAPVAAHNIVTVPPYTLEVGWRVEPAVAGSLNGLDLGITNATGAPVPGAESTFNATLSTGPASIVKRVEPQSERAGWYTFDVVPTRIGAYTVRLQGFLGTTRVDVNVTLDDVIPVSDLAFPTPDPTAPQLQSQIQDARTTISALQGQLTIALVLAALGLVVGVVGVAMGWRRARSPPKAL